MIQLIMPERLDADALARMLGDISRADFGDPRRSARVLHVLTRLVATPNASLPDALVTHAELEGAYRLFGNKHVTFEKLIDAHASSTADRARGSNVVLAIHDTTNCMFRHADPREVGYLSTGKPGCLLHLSLLLDTQDWRRPLGLTHAEVLSRSTPPRKPGRKHKVASHVTAKQTDKEFSRWKRGIDSTEARLEGTKTIVIHIADREIDSYDVMAGCLKNGRRFIFRARNNRTTIVDGKTVPIRTLIESADIVLEREVPLSRRLTSSAPARKRAHPARESRTARLSFTATTATVRRPRIAGTHLPETIELNVLHVFEANPPAGQDPVDWVLYTTEPLDTRKQIEQVVDYYRCRWQIEELNKALKTGCVVQERQLESFDALTTMLALSLPIAVELLALRALARADAAAPATTLVSKPRLAALRHLCKHRPLPPKPTVQDVLWCIAGLGGHIKNNGPAGWQVLQRGMEKFVAFADGWCARENADDL
ncbi:MAG TPA: IS4 family transposase [Kofleriaceae bacterium]